MNWREAGDAHAVWGGVTVFAAGPAQPRPYLLILWLFIIIEVHPNNNASDHNPKAGFIIT